MEAALKGRKTKWLSKRKEEREEEREEEKKKGRRKRRKKGGRKRNPKVLNETHLESPPKWRPRLRKTGQRER